DQLGACLARARHILEAQWGLTTLEIPQSLVCTLESFHWLVAHLAAQLPRFLAVHNDVVRQYRRMYHIRNASHPVPDLAVEGEWLEAPFWIWSRDHPRRKHLFIKHGRSELVLTDRQDINLNLPITEDGDAARAVDRLVELEQRGVKIRSRALITTLWARLVLGDLFLHGIGGGNYDRITDRIIERFFNRSPPAFMILSATLHLPIPKTSPLPLGEGQGEGSPASKRDVGPQEDLAAIDQKLRELTYHPERFLDGVFDGSSDIPNEVQSLVDQKRQWIETPQTIQNARTRCHAIRYVNESLQPWVDQQRQRLLQQRVQVAEQLQTKQILSWREYGFCLYPEEMLLNFMESLLPR
ncbi:MAG TPA: hypothetical protein VIH42_09020, partial [Thermoguttaceae bacterium]